MMRSAISFCLLGAIVIASVTGTAHASNSTIVFCSDRGPGGNEIYSMDADGSNVVQLTFGFAEAYHAMCSPDGRRIVFVTDREGDYEIYIINVDGSGLQRLTDNPADDLAPSWSRDGSKIAFTSDRDGDREIFVMNSDGSGLQQLTNNDDTDGFQDFSPDGSRIVFHSNRSGFVDIWVMNADGGSPVNLTGDAASDWMPEWSPDGTEIVFESDRNGPLELYIMDADGGNDRRLTYNFSDNHEPDWSPDGSRIMYASFQGGDYDIMLIDPDGSDLQNLTSNSGVVDVSPSWLPETIDGESSGGGTGMLAYCNQPVSAPDIHEIYTIHIDGTQKRQLIETSIGLNHHEWSPDGTEMAAVGYTDVSTWSIYTFDADGGNLTRITDTAGVWDNEPSWSSDGVRLAWGRIYPSARYRSELWIMNADGTGQHSIGVEGDGVRWSPDDTRLLYFKELASVDIWSCDVDGANEQQLTSSAGDNMAPDWSPDGSKVVFVSTRDGNHEIYVMNSDGSNQQRLTIYPGYDFAPTWSPDGELIAFGREVAGDGRWEVFVMDASGADVRRVTYSPPDRTAINPDWQPDDATGVSVYLVRFHHTRDGDRVTLGWEVADHAAAEDFRVVAEQDGDRREVPVMSEDPWSFEAIDVAVEWGSGGTVTYDLFLHGSNGGWDLLAREYVEFVPRSAGAGIVGIHPNPFNPLTTVSFAVDRTRQVRLDIHDLAGQFVATLVDGIHPAGEHQVRWDGRGQAGGEAASGIYFLRFRSDGWVETRKLVLLR